MMCRLNYTDLLYMIVEYDIDTVTKYLKQMAQLDRDKKNIEIVDATPEMATEFFKGGS